MINRFLSHVSFNSNFECNGSFSLKISTEMLQMILTTGLTFFKVLNFCYNISE